LLSGIVSLISVILAFFAVSVSAWQARANMQHARRSRSLPVIAEIFKEYRSKEFRKSIHNLLSPSSLSLSSEKTAGYGLMRLSEDRREDVYKVCYFFDYIGTLVAFGIIREDIVIAVMGTDIMRVWSAMSKVIKNERDHRLKLYKDSDVPPGFLVFYEHLVTRIEALGGSEAATRIQRRIGVRRPPTQDA
jgi:hypothetical protein